MVLSNTDKYDGDYLTTKKKKVPRAVDEIPYIVNLREWANRQVRDHEEMSSQIVKQKGDRNDPLLNL